MRRRGTGFGCLKGAYTHVCRNQTPTDGGELAVFPGFFGRFSRKKDPWKEGEGSPRVVLLVPSLNQAKMGFLKKTPTPTHPVVLSLVRSCRSKLRQHQAKTGLVSN